MSETRKSPTTRELTGAEIAAVAGGDTCVIPPQGHFALGVQAGFGLGSLPNSNLVTGLCNAASGTGCTDLLTNLGITC
jgi:hypothetical protein